MCKPSLDSLKQTLTRHVKGHSHPFGEKISTIYSFKIVISWFQVQPLLISTVTLATMLRRPSFQGTVVSNESTSYQPRLTSLSSHHSCMRSNATRREYIPPISGPPCSTVRAKTSSTGLNTCRTRHAPSSLKNLQKPLDVDM
jgi:hypothetical protein